MHYQVLTRIDFGKPLGFIDPGSKVVVVELPRERGDPLVSKGWLKVTTAAVNYPQSVEPEPDQNPPKTGTKRRRSKAPQKEADS